jgi:hypothetical protein
VRWAVGVDLGQSRDYSAVVVIDRASGSLDVRYCSRLPLGMSYATQLRRLSQILARCGPRGDNGGLRVAIDRTGLGGPVLEMAWKLLTGYAVTGVSITAGTHANTAGRTWTVPKIDLVDSLALALESGSLRAASGLSDLDSLISELKGFSYASTEGATTMGADAEAGHDDLVIAVSLATYLDSRIGGGSHSRTRMRYRGPDDHRRIEVLAGPRARLGSVSHGRRARSYGTAASSRDHPGRVRARFGNGRAQAGTGPPAACPERGLAAGRRWTSAVTRAPLSGRPARLLGFGPLAPPHSMVSPNVLATLPRWVDREDVRGLSWRDSHNPGTSSMPSPPP